MLEDEHELRGEACDGYSVCLYISVYVSVVYIYPVVEHLCVFRTNCCHPWVPPMVVTAVLRITVVIAIAVLVAIAIAV